MKENEPGRSDRGAKRRSPVFALENSKLGELKTENYLITLHVDFLQAVLFKHVLEDYFESH